MFYAHFVLSKRGPLARVWLAAHWDKKLTKAHVFETSIETSVEGILQPKVKMALRTSGHLLLGVVRIYSRKAKYLLADCNEAFVKIKMAFRPGVVDLPEDNREAAVATITLPEVFHDFDTTMPEINDIDMQAQFNMNQSRAEEITIREEFGSSTNALLGDDGFGDIGFDDPEMGRDMPQMDQLDKGGAIFGDEAPPGSSQKHKENSSVVQTSNLELDAPLRDDGFGGGDGEGLLAVETSGLFEPGGLFDDAPMEQPAMDSSNVDGQKSKQDIPDPLNQAANQSDDDDDYYGDMGPPSMGAPSSGPSSPGSPGPVPSTNNNMLQDSLTNDASLVNQTDLMLPPAQPEIPQQQQDQSVMPPPMIDQTTLLQNEDESFALAPLEQTVLHGPERTIKAKRKRKLIVDEVKNISGEEMKSQLSDSTDIITTLDLAPPTKRLMHWKETGGVEKLFALPGNNLLSKHISKLFQRHLTTKSVENERIVLNEDDEDDDHQIQLEEQETTNEIEKQRNASSHDQMTPNVSAQLESSNLKRHLEEDVTGLQTQRSRLDLDQSAMPQMPSMQDDSQYMQTPQLHEDSQFMTPHHQPLQDASQFLPPQQSSIHDPSFFQHPNMQSNQVMPPPPMNQSLPQQMPMQMQPPLSQSMQLPSTPVHDIFAPNSQEIPSVPSTPIPSDSFFQQPTPLSDPLMQQIGESRLNMHDDDDDIYNAPASVGPPEEQAADETYEQYEERVINKRTAHMMSVVKSKFFHDDKIIFSDVVSNNKRKMVAQKFYTFLVLKKQQICELYQEVPFGDLIITKGPEYEKVL